MTSGSPPVGKCSAEVAQAHPLCAAAFAAAAPLGARSAEAAPAVGFCKPRPNRAAPLPASLSTGNSRQVVEGSGNRVTYRSKR